MPTFRTVGKRKSLSANNSFMFQMICIDEYVRGKQSKKEFRHEYMLVCEVVHCQRMSVSFNMQGAMMCQSSAVCTKPQSAMVDHVRPVQALSEGVDIRSS